MQIFKMVGEGLKIYLGTNCSYLFISDKLNDLKYMYNYIPHKIIDEL